MEIKKKHRIMLYSALILGTILVNNSYQAKAEELIPKLPQRPK